MSWTPETGVYMDSHYNLVYPKGATHLDGVDKETMEVIHDHWGSFPPQHPLVASIVGISFFVLWMINLFGNGSVCYIFLKVKSLRTPSNLFVVNLAFSDLCMMTTMGLPVVINAFTQRYWMWGAFGKNYFFLFSLIFFMTFNLQDVDFTVASEQSLVLARLCPWWSSVTTDTTSS